jgi:nicotinamidase-related amidase
MDISLATALLLIDIQNDYFPGGKVELDGSCEASGNAGNLLQKFRELGAPCIHIQHVSSRPGAMFFLPDTDGVKFHPDVTPQAGELIFHKHFSNSFRETGLADHLRQTGIKRLVIAGMMTHMCVDSSVRAAADLGFECILAHDACATKALKFNDQVIAAHNVHLSFLAALGHFARVLPSHEILKELDGTL